MKKLSKKEIKRLKQEEKDLTTLNNVKAKIKEGEIYKYKELCEIFNESPTDGNSKKSQLKDWKRFIDWTNPTTQQYLITEVYLIHKKKTDGRKTNGNKELGKSKLNIEFDYLLGYFMKHEYTANEYRLNKPNWESTYFTNKRISIFFGLFSKSFYKANNDENVNSDVFMKISEKIREKRRSWIIDKIRKRQEDIGDVELTYSTMAYKHKDDEQPEYKDELLEEYKKYKQVYMDDNKFKLDIDIINCGKWNDMIDEVSSHIEGYEKVTQCYKLEFKKEETTYDYKLVKEYKKRFNDEIIKDMYNYFLRRFKQRPEENEDYQIELMQAAQEGYSVNYRFTKEKEELLMKPYVYVFDNYVRI